MELSKEEIWDKYLRAASKFEEYKQRQEKEIIKIKKLACKELLEDILPVVDGLEMLMKISTKNIGAVKSITNLFQNVLKKHNVTPIKNPTGYKFNPQFHKSLESTVTKYPKETVIKQFRKGYMLDDILLRPTNVSISR